MSKHGEENKRTGAGAEVAVLEQRFHDAGGWAEVLSRIVSGSGLDRSLAEATMSEVLHGRATEAQLGGLLVGLGTKGETVEEIVGFVSAMQAAAEPLQGVPGAIDIVGTGGSPHRRRHALNISTMASFVAAGCGAAVCKHGNRRASSTSGSFDFLEALGVAIDLSPAQLQECIEATGVGFLFARSFHPAMRFAGPARSELSIPTVFNILGPIANPARVSRQVVGTATVERAEALARVLAERNAEFAWVVSGDGGLDELSTTGASTIFQVIDGGVERMEVRPENVGLSTVVPEAIQGGDPARNVEIFTSILEGAESPQAEIVLLNAAAGLVVGGLATDLSAGIDLARDALASGRVGEKVAQVRQVSTQLVR